MSRSLPKNPADSTDFHSDKNLSSTPAEGYLSQPNQSSKPVPVLLSIDKAAKISGLGRNNLAYLIKHHKFPVVKLPGYNRIKIYYKDLLDFIENNKCIYTSVPTRNHRNDSLEKDSLKKTNRSVPKDPLERKN